MIRVLFVVLVAVCITGSLNAQDTIKEFTVGDQVAELPFKTLPDEQQAKFSIKDYKGKLLIIDFWNTFCTSCIASWPKLQKLQNQYKDKIQILLLNTEPDFDPKEKLDLFFAKRKERNLIIPDLPFINGATEFKKVFPYYSIPHIVWINSTGKVIAITEGDHLNQENIEKALSGSLNLPLKVGHSVRYERDKPFLVNGNGGDESKFLYRSVFTPYIEGLVGGLTGRLINDVTNTQKISYLNTGISSMISSVYDRELSKYFPLANKSKVIDVRLNDMFRYRGPKDVKERDNFKSKHTYCYELEIPNDSTYDIYDIARKDLDMFFRLNSKIELRNLSCLKLIRTSEKDKIATKSLEPFTNSSEGESKDIIIKSYPISHLIGVLNNENSDLPIIVDQTGFKGNIDIILSKDAFRSVEKLRKALQKYDLDLQETVREFNVLVIRDKDPLVTVK